MEQQAAAETTDFTDSSTSENLLETLRHRLDENLLAHEVEMLSLTPQEIYDRAGEIIAVKDAHYYLNDVHAMSSRETAFLLQFQNPLEVVADAWREKRDNVGDIQCALETLLDSGDATSRYTLVGQRESTPGEHSAEKPSILAQIQKPVEHSKQEPTTPGSRMQETETR